MRSSCSILATLGDPPLTGQVIRSWHICIDSLTPNFDFPFLDNRPLSYACPRSPRLEGSTCSDFRTPPTCQSQHLAAVGGLPFTRVTEWSPPRNRWRPQAGLEVLANGGNAVDAAIAAALVDAVTMPASCGVGGDLFAIVSKPAGGGGFSELTSVISSGISPRGATLEFMREHSELDGRVLPQAVPLSPSVPGLPGGIDALLAQFGSKPLTKLSKAAIGYAAEGFPVTQRLSAMISGQRGLLERFSPTESVFLPGGQALGPGAMLKQPDLAVTIDQIARESSTAFYQGSIAKRIGNFLGGNGGALTAEDFSDHEAWVGAPLQSTYRGKTVYQTGLPTQGFVQLEAQNILEGFDLSAIGTDSALGVHLMVESLKRAFHDRHLYAGDPNVVDVPMDKLLSGMGGRAARNHRPQSGVARHQIDLSLSERYHVSLRHRP